MKLHLVMDLGAINMLCTNSRLVNLKLFQQDMEYILIQKKIDLQNMDYTLLIPVILLAAILLLIEEQDLDLMDMKYTQVHLLNMSKNCIFHIYHQRIPVLTDKYFDYLSPHMKIEH